jgi:serine/threonine protein kinase
VLNPPNVPAEGEIIANRFRLIRELGRGSMGTVWLAHHLTLEVPCAIKFIVAEGTDDPNYRTRFHIEARTIAQVQSPHVVRVLDHSLSDDAAPYIAMEFLDGEDLWSRLHRVGRLDPRATYDIVCQVARGLSKAHGAGIIHRDLKPENVFSRGKARKKSSSSWISALPSGRCSRLWTKPRGWLALRST